MAKAKNTISNEQNELFSEVTVITSQPIASDNSSVDTIESLVKSLEEIESKISEGNLTISEQISELNKARGITKKIKELLSEAKAEINIIEND